MSKRAEEIKEMIEDRKERGDITKCVFYVTTPKLADTYKDAIMKKVENLLDKGCSGA